MYSRWFDHFKKAFKNTVTVYPNFQKCLKKTIFTDNNYDLVKSKLMKDSFSIKSKDESKEVSSIFDSQEKNRSDFDALGDSQIWKLFQEGKESAFIHIYQKHFHGLFEYGCQFTNNEPLVEDALQDMFIELRNKRRKTFINSSIRNYLFTCLRRRVLLYKKKFNDSAEYFEESEFRLFDIGISKEQQIIESQIRKENEVRLARVVKTLSTRQREAIYYLYYEEMNYHEIKELMGFTNIRSVRNLIYRALASMKNAFCFLILLRFL